MLKIVDCYNCGSARHVNYLRENGFALVKCEGCGLLYVRERPDEEAIEQATVDGKHRSGEHDLDANVRYNPAVKKVYLRQLPSIFPTGYANIRNWLDIGCGYGEFIETLKDLAPSIAVIGSEPNAVKQASAKKRGLNVSYFDTSTHDEQYDVVSLLNVYSHLPDPKAFIREIRRLIRPGGQILIQTGNVADLSSDDILKPLSLPDHLSFTSEKILTDMLSDLGFKDINAKCFHAFPLDFNKIVKEAVKTILPGKVSYLRYYAYRGRYARVNMFVMARLA